MTAISEVLEGLKGQAEAADEIEVVRKRHGYEIDGQFLRRVTTFTGGMPKPWLGRWAAKMVAEFAIEHQDQWSDLPKTDAMKLLKTVPWSKRDDARDRGTAVHNTIEAMVNGRAIPDDLTDDELNCSAAAEAFIKERGSKILATELTVFNLTHGYAGTLDLWEIDIKGVTWILDWKTSKGVYVEHAVQQAAYRNAEFAVVQKRVVASAGSQEKWVGKVIPWGPEMARMLGIVHVRPNGATLHPIRYSDRLWTTFRAAAHTKLFQLDTDSAFGKTPRLEVFDDPVEVTTKEEAVA